MLIVLTFVCNCFCCRIQSLRGQGRRCAGGSGFRVSRSGARRGQPALPTQAKPTMRLANCVANALSIRTHAVLPTSSPYQPVTDVGDQPPTPNPHRPTPNPNPQPPTARAGADGRAPPAAVRAAVCLCAAAPPAPCGTPRGLHDVGRGVWRGRGRGGLPQASEQDKNDQQLRMKITAHVRVRTKNEMCAARTGRPPAP